MKDQKTKVKKEKKQMSDGKKNIIGGSVLNFFVPGAGTYFIAKGICMEVRENKAADEAKKKRIKESEEIGKTCDEIIALRKAESSKDEEPEEEIDNEEES